MAKNYTRSKFEDLNLPESFRSVYEANPYANVSPVGGFLGIGKKKNAQELALRSAEYDANLAAQAQAADYNSPEAQSERLRSAGINPNLSGNLDAGSMDAASVPIGDVNTPDPSQQIAELSGTLLNIASLAMAFPEGFASLNALNLESGLSLANAGASLASAFPEDSVNIAPSPLAPVMIKSGVPAENIADSIPNLSRSQRKALAKSIRTNRESLRSTLSSASSRKQLVDILNSPSVSIPETARNIIFMEQKLTEVQLKGELKKQVALSKFSDDIASQAADNARREVEVEGEELSARSSAASASRANSAAIAAEAGVRRDVARSTDGAAIGEARSAEAIVNKIDAETAQEQLRVIEDAEVEGLFDTSFVGDILEFKIGTGREREDFQKILERRGRRRNAKRNQKRYYKQSASNSSITISPKGVSYSE